MNKQDNFFEEIQQKLEYNTDEYQYIPTQEECALPSLVKIEEIVELTKEIFFPGFFRCPTIPLSQAKAGTVLIERLQLLLEGQIAKGLCFFNHQSDVAESQLLSLSFIDKLPKIKRLLCTDIKAVFDGDPAAQSYGEVIFCYPAIQSMIHHRIAHELFLLNIPALPRIISERAHSITGIDIHPGARIGEYFSIDHGTGVVIGETCIIGNHVRLYQGVTLGARGFKFDEDGNPMNIPRHPILEDNVTIYSNASVLGRITIGEGTVVGGNIWLTHSVPPKSRILQSKALESSFQDGLGI